jgi:NAD(P)H-nitrite reductase large subunit
MAIRLPADLVVTALDFARLSGWRNQAGLAIDHVNTVDEHLETSIPGIFAASDIARWPDRFTGERIRVELADWWPSVKETRLFGPLQYRRRA